MEDDLLKVIEIVKECNIEELNNYRYVNINRSVNGKCWFDKISFIQNKEMKLELIKYVLSTFIIDINLENEDGETLLFHLYEDSDIEIIEYLSEVIDFHHTDRNNKTLYDYTIEYNSIKLIGYLRDKMKGYSRKTKLFKAMMKGSVSNINKCILDGDNVIGYFKYSELSDEESYNLNVFIDNINNVYYSQIIDFSSFLLLISMLSLPIHLEVERFRVFIKGINYGIDDRCDTLTRRFNLDSLMFDDINLLYAKNSRCLIHNICLTNNLELVNIFLSKNPNCLMRMMDSGTALHLCTKRGREKMLKLFVDNVRFKLNNIKIKKTDKTPLHCAVFNNNINAVKILMEYGEDLNAKDARGECVITYALSQNKIEIHNYLMKICEAENHKRKMEQLLYDESPMKRNREINIIEDY